MKLRLVRRPAEPLDADLEIIDSAERDRARAMRTPADSAAFVTAHAEIRRLVGHALRIPAREVCLDAQPGRPPRIVGSSLACSIAHGGDLVAVAVSRGGRIGVDVEHAADIPAGELAAIARNILCAPPEEVEAIARASDGGGVFLERWTLIEAVLKAIGTGLAADPADVLIERTRGAPPRLLGAPGVSAEDASAWLLRVARPIAGHVVALAVDRAGADPAAGRTA